ncbi:MAG TPA: autotransporter-associated beta strand repeat-containing protein, partial [Pirellulales bacterium]|nr:autotransporter-associated beta strand repeat-containing protein [Pirellulales bacterium]
IVAGQVLLNPSDVNSTLNYIGKSQYSADPLFSGMIDDFRIYNYALNQSQMLNLVPRRWTGALSSSWTTATLANPKNWQVVSNATDYASGDVVLFDDSASAFTVSVTDATVSPTNPTFDNSKYNYILTGPGAVAGNGTLTKNGSATLTINNANSYSGGTVINAGTLDINNGSAIGTGALTVAGNSTIDNNRGVAVTLSTNNAQIWAADFTFGGTNPLNMGTGLVTMTGNRTITTNGTAALTVGSISESGGAWALTKAGPGTLELDGPPSLPAGSLLNVTGGRLRLNVSSGSATIGTGVSATIAPGATLELAGLVAALSSGANRVNVTNSSAAVILVSGSHQQIGNLDGSGTTQINAGSDLTANHIIQNGLVIGGAGGSLGVLTIAASSPTGNPLVGATTSMIAGNLTGSFAEDPSLATGLTAPIGAENNDVWMSSLPAAASEGPATSAVPEPSSLLLGLVGLIALRCFGRRFRGSRCLPFSATLR